VLADGVEEHAAIHGLVAGLRAARTDVCVVLPVDTPNVTAAALRALADACRDAAIPQTGPLPGAYRKRALSALASGELSIRRAIAGLDVAVVELDDRLLANVNTPQDLEL
jgi:molybdopterin-guanine dinucleotide biosynthesis protein A